VKIGINNLRENKADGFLPNENFINNHCGLSNQKSCFNKKCEENITHDGDDDKKETKIDEVTKMKEYLLKTEEGRRILKELHEKTEAVMKMRKQRASQKH
jgi:hypothetical protein